MESDNKNTFFEKLWWLKIICAILVPILSIRFASPLSTVLMQSLSFSDKYRISFDTPESKNAEDTLNKIKAEQIQEFTTKAQETTQVSTEEEETTTIKENAFTISDDIKAFEKDYLAVFNSEKPYGTVEEVFFKTSGATDSVAGIHIKNATATKKPDYEALLSEGPALQISDKSLPTVLIFHTHTTESYLLADNGVFYEDFQTRSNDSDKNMIRIGEEICKILEENGIGFIHDKTVYDESYEGAYSRSRKTVEKILKENPSIKIVLDVHRDAIYYSDTSHCKPTAVIDDKKAAQIMIITGAEEGYISDFPHWEDNLKFALCFQKTAEDKYPGLMKPLYFCQRKYNMDTAKCSLLLEVGTDANTLEEAVYSGYLTGKVLCDIINNHSE